ncbi:FAD-dependent monooxygenase [Undibacterium sp. CY21W]|uniref:FAD-dependent monooxygenase n=1 Tax=Undibacterium sp. CY21W TaxID=2762293 RepID=UPI00164CD491|nr:FAD-dependent monooxygenase [Undibacterium sp. CY21W]MBC3928996.1 FAD-dependent monooxygenase [Undibacterium sp. CY21W]
MTAQIHHCDICIVGNGAVGKAAALGFAQAGLKVAVLCRSTVALPMSAQWDVRVFALNHIAHDLLSSLKVWDALDLQRVAPVTEMNVRGGKSVDDGQLAFDAYGARTGELAWIVEDKNLNHALDTAMKFAQNLSVVTGAAASLHADEQGAQINLEDGSQIKASLIVGADGAQSWVRGQCDIGLDYRSYGQQGVVTNFECEIPHHGVAHQWFVEEQGIIALLPLPGNRVSLVWSAPDALAATLLREPLSALVSRLEEYCLDTLGHLTPVLPEDIKAFPLRLIRPHSMIAQRVALIGDAAHAVHPLAGHGMNLGFGDVTSLLALMKSREDHCDCGDAKLLERYRRSRKEDVMLMQITTDGLARLFGSDLAPLRLARNVGLNLLNRLPVLKNKLISHAMGK